MIELAREVGDERFVHYFYREYLREQVLYTFHSTALIPDRFAKLVYQLASEEDDRMILDRLTSLGAYVPATLSDDSENPPEESS